MALKNMVPFLVKPFRVTIKFTKKNHFASVNKSFFYSSDFYETQSLEQAYKPKMASYAPVTDFLHGEKQRGARITTCIGEG